MPVFLSEMAHLPYRRMRLLVVARSLIQPIPDYQPKIAIEIRPFEEADLRLVRQINRPSECNECARRIASGHIGLAALHQGQLIGYAWGCTVVDPELEGVQVKLVPGDVLCMDVYTAPAYRGLGVQTALTLRRFQMFRDLGFTRAICTIERNNTPSLVVWQRKLGSVTTGRIDYFRIGPWYRVRYHQSFNGHDWCKPAKTAVSEINNSSGVSR
jgi:GNAT superfamily N-acetyltransferase